MQIYNNLGRYQLVPLCFAQDTVAANQSGVALRTTEADASVALNEYYTMPWSGEIIAVTSNLDAAATVGTLTIRPTRAGVEVSAPQIAQTTLAHGASTCRRSTAPFAANAQIGCKITTTANWNGTTRDLQVIVWVLLRIIGI